MCDIDGLLTSTRKTGNLEGHKIYYAKDHEPMSALGDIVKKIKPSVNNLINRILINNVCIYIFYIDSI